MNSNPEVHPVQVKRDALAQALGHAISRWTNVELAFVATFSTATNMPNNMSASILRNIRNFSTILNMTNSAVQWNLKGTEAITYWKSLVEYAQELSGDRNYMAHQAMVLHSPGPPDTVDPELVKPKIGPNVLAALAGGPTDIHRSLDEAEILEILADFQYLLESVMEFDQALKDDATSQTKFSNTIRRRRPPRKERLQAELDTTD